jgi:hypothetical protein
MSYRHLVFAVLGISLFGPVQASQLGYTFDLSNGLFSQDCQLLEDITGQTPDVFPGVCVVPDAGAFGSITYDNEGAFAGDNGVGGSLYSATVSLTSTLVIGGSEIGTITGDNGTVVINDDPGGNDLVNVGINNGNQNWSTFMIGDYQIVTGLALWINGDFLADEMLPDMLPPPPGYEQNFFNFGVVDTVNSPGVIQGFGAIGLELMPVPVPTAIWLFGSALGLLGWMRRKTR